MSVKEYKESNNANAWVGPIFIIFLVVITTVVLQSTYHKNTHHTPPGYYSVKKYCFNCHNDFTKDYKFGTKRKRPEVCPKCGVADSN